MGIANLLLVYGALAEVGGVMGYVTAKSKASLLAGSITGSLLIVSGLLALRGVPWGVYLGLGATLALTVIVWTCYIKTRKVVPTGLMLGISVVVAAILFTELF